MSHNYTKQILALAQEKGVLQSKTLRDSGIPYVYLSRLEEQGLIEKIGRGLYRVPNAPISEHHGLVTAAARVPNGVICLLSALSFYEMTTQIPFQVWIALENKAWAPKKHGLPIRYVYFSGEAFSEGIETNEIEGTSVSIYNPAKTVADCFKYRHKIGLDIAIEALRDGFRQRKFSVDELLHYSKICRVQNVMRPYIEATL